MVLLERTSVYSERDPGPGFPPARPAVLPGRFGLSRSRAVAVLRGFLIPYPSYPRIALSKPRVDFRARAYAWQKRALDLGLSLSALTLLSPLLAGLAVLIKLDSRGGAFFKQQRVGKDGRLFEIYKFRSLHVGTPRFAVKPRDGRDPRITRIGRWIRRYGIDEVPQLFNVLKGDMSLVGPRPEMPFLVAQHPHIHKDRLSVLPGLTGLWQVKADRKTLIHEHPEHDLYYVRNACLGLDFEIIGQTVSFLLKGQNGA